MNDTERAKLADLAGRVDDCLIFARQLVAATAEPGAAAPQLVHIIDTLDEVKEELGRLAKGGRASARAQRQPAPDGAHERTIHDERNQEWNCAAVPSARPEQSPYGPERSVLLECRQSSNEAGVLLWVGADWMTMPGPALADLIAQADEP